MADSFSDPLLQQRLESVKPCAVVFIGADAPVVDEVVARYDIYCKSLDEVTDASLREIQTLAAQQSPPEQVAADETSPIQTTVSVTGVLQLDGETHALDPLLGLAIRLFPEQLLVHCSEPAIGDERFFALGFRRLNRSGNHLNSTTGSRWYEYRLSHYKDQPDWLNARFWANPGRFGEWDDPDFYSDEEE